MMRSGNAFLLVFSLWLATGTGFHSLTFQRPQIGIAELACASEPFGRQGASTQPLEAQARAALAITNGNVKLKGLKQPVTVLRDRWGVPHIYAENQHDLFFGQGFVASQDRLFQMEIWKRAGQGRLAEVLGPTMLDRDVKARLLRYRGPMEAEYSSYTPEGRLILEAFTAGINAYIRYSRSPESPGLPLEFRLAGFEPEPWKPEDCLNRSAALGGNASAELYHAQLVVKLGLAKAARIIGLDPPVKLDPVEGLDLSGLSPAVLHGMAGADARVEFPSQGKAFASNNWTISGKLTRSGKPILANDPHRGYSVPSLRYIVHLVAPGWNVIGAVEPGWPGVTIGHNERIAWGMTIFGIDQQDLYVETLDPSDSLRYKTENGWARMETGEQEIRVKGKGSVKALLKFTRHGPVMWEDAANHRAVAMRWVGMEPGGAGYLGSLAISRAQDWQEFEEAMARWKIPSENIVYADTAGNIGVHSVGLAPCRKKWTGLLPVPGHGGYEWEGFVPVSELPHELNPAQGFIVTANQKRIPENYSYAVGFQWEPAYRARRIEEVLQHWIDSGRQLDLEDMARLQGDVVSIPARELALLLRGAARGVHDAPTKVLTQWDGTLAHDAPAAALYEVWLEELERAVYHKLAPELPWDQIADHWSLPSVVLQQLRKPGLDVFGPQPAAARDSLMLEALKRATTKLAQIQGTDPRRWTWGGLHRVLFRHPLDQMPRVAALVNAGPLARPGDGSTVNASFYRGAGFDVISGPSYRQILDLADWDRSLAINAPGQSGQPGSPHYSDLLPLWAEGLYFPLVYSRSAVEKHSRQRLVLVP